MSVYPETRQEVGLDEPHWVHGKRAVAEPDRLLAAQDLIERACAYFACPHEKHLCLPEKIA
jgi:hypothetical protein